MTYALITGASKGIGKAIAEELASQQINLLLVARDGLLLEELTQILKQQYKIQANFLAVDLATPNAVKTLNSWIETNSFQIKILVNNAGYGSKWPIYRLYL